MKIKEINMYTEEQLEGVVDEVFGEMYNDISWEELEDKVLSGYFYQISTDSSDRKIVVVIGADGIREHFRLLKESGFPSQLAEEGISVLFAGDEDEGNVTIRTNTRYIPFKNVEVKKLNDGIE
jgi:hypothetical protein